MDIIVTTPKSQMDVAAQEAEEVKAAGGGIYFRYLGRRPKDLEAGDRCFYVEDGFIRGLAVVVEVTDTPGMVCDTTGRQFRAGYYAFMDAETWQWIKPIPHKGFQGWRYFNPGDIKIIGGWLDPRPATP